MAVLDRNVSLQQHGVKMDGYLQENNDLLPQPRLPLPRPDVKVSLFWKGPSSRHASHVALKLVQMADLS